MLLMQYVSESVSPVHGLTVESLWLSVCRCGEWRSVGFVGLSCGVSHLHGGGKDISCPRKKELKSPLEGKARVSLPGQCLQLPLHPMLCSHLPSAKACWQGEGRSHDEHDQPRG